MTETIPQLLPKGWKELQLGEVVSKERGAFVNGLFGSDLLTSELVAEGVPVIYIRDIKDGIYKRVSNVCVTPQKAQDLEVCQIRPGDILVAKVGDPPGISAIYPNGYPHAVVTQDVIKIKVNSHLILPEYLIYFLNSAKGQKTLHPIIVEGTRSRFGLTPFKEIEIPVPPIAEQKRIATIAQKADRLRRTRRYTLELSDSCLRSVFLEMFGDPVVNPKGWKSYTLDQVSKKITDGEHLNPVFQRIGYPIVMAQQVEDDGVNLSDCCYVSEADFLKFTRKCNPQLQDILLVSRGATIGRSCVVNVDKGFCLMGSVILIKPNDNFINSQFLSYLLKTSSYQKILKTTSGSSAQQAIYIANLREKPVIIPPLPLQEKFAQIVQRFERLRIQQREAERQAEHLFQTILNRAFRGEL